MYSYTLQASTLVLSLCFNQAIGAAVSISSKAATTSPPTIAPPNLSEAIASLTGAKATRTLTSVAQATGILQSIDASLKTNNVTSFFDRATLLTQNGFFGGTLLDLTTTLLSGDNSALNFNPAPKTNVYPKAGSSDAPYNVLEAQLRGAVRIPSTFTYGKKPPVILFPGTGATGYTSFAGNFIKTLKNVDYADPVWVNVPGFLDGDAQTNAEYAAYAINYIASLTARNVSVIAWSQGNIDTQWAFKYWPSTRSKVTDFISISPDFHGTKLAYLLCTGLNLIGCTPSVFQQTYNSKFISTLRANGGDSAYVPTTTIYSTTDEIVQPQSPSDASAIILDARKVGVSNTNIQTVCGTQPGGGVVTHEGAMANSLTFALAVDALQNPGPGSLSRINTAQVCSQPLAPGLGLADLITTEASIVIAALTLITYIPKALVEPPIQAYALAG